MKTVEELEPRKFKQAIRIREVASGKVILCLENQTGVSSYTLSSDNRLLAIGDKGGCIRLVEVMSGKEVQRLQGHRGSVASLEFSADGAFLVSGGEDTTALVWDVLPLFSAENIGKPERLSETLWADLASQDGARAFRAALVLRANPEKAIDFLKHRLRPIPQLDPKAAQQMIDDLDNDRFEVRERAMDVLRGLERTAAPLLKKALKTSRSAETRQRLEQLSTEAEEPPWRELRATHCLAFLDTESARQLLQDLAKGAPEARLTQQAREALEWLK
jgi:hypothetical protein